VLTLTDGRGGVPAGGPQAWVVAAAAEKIVLAIYGFSYILMIGGGTTSP
jgi:hypothetical protein